ncbi:DUF2787 family protein [Shewanella sp. Shew256]|uniref:DUF2787 family protein n=1 Tax=Shewanella sp. Shew256 TaxID=1969376 RepID=UPI000B49D9DF|nr:DUF2787 family protein [Shewanella sp. Shew256]
MTPTIQIDLKAARSLLPMTLSLTQIIRRLLLKNLPPIVSHGVTINFRDPSYSADAGGFHPVEIRLEYSQATSMWQVCYITDFAYQGRYYPELEKDIDFNFAESSGYQAYVGFHPLSHFSGLYRLWEANFRSYVVDDIYLITINWD